MRFDPVIGAEIVRLISDGKSLVEICAQPGFPHRQRVHEWIAENVDGFADKYARARETQAEHYADEIIAIADGVARNATSEEVQAARLQVDSRKWVASKLAPKKYGDKVSHEHGSDPERPVVNVLKIVGVRAEPKE